LNPEFMGIGPATAPAAAATAGTMGGEVSDLLHEDGVSSVGFSDCCWPQQGSSPSAPAAGDGAGVRGTDNIDRSATWGYSVPISSPSGIEGKGAAGAGYHPQQQQQQQEEGQLGAFGAALDGPCVKELDQSGVFAEGVSGDMLCDLVSPQLRDQLRWPGDKPVTKSSIASTSGGVTGVSQQQQQKQQQGKDEKEEGRVVSSKPRGEQQQSLWHQEGLRNTQQLFGLQQQQQRQQIFGLQQQ
jgi:hypothetical protein